MPSSVFSFAAATRVLSKQILPKQHHHPNIHKLPKRIILLRHGESLGNVDETAYANIPDWKIPLTRRGERQALRAAQDLRNLLTHQEDHIQESLFTYSSPYKRTTETWEIMEDYLAKEGTVELIGTRQEPRIAEQQFGNFQV